MRLIPPASFQTRPISFEWLTKVISTKRGEWLQRVVEDALNARVKEVMGDDEVGHADVSEKFK